MGKDCYYHFCLPFLHIITWHFGAADLNFSPGFLLFLLLIFGKRKGATEKLREGGREEEL